MQEHNSFFWHSKYQSLEMFEVYNVFLLSESDTGRYSWRGYRELFSAHQFFVPFGKNHELQARVEIDVN